VRDYRAVVNELASIERVLLTVLEIINLLPSTGCNEVGEGVKERVENFISESNLVLVRTEVAKILVRVISLESTFEKFDARWNKDVKAFQNDTINFMTSFKKEITTKVDKLNSELTSLSNLLKG
jgi:hypothetical protein